jgi:hypothetical protein
MNRFSYLPLTVVLAGVLAGVAIHPSHAREWIDQPVITAAGRVFAQMPDDYS